MDGKSYRKPCLSQVIAKIDFAMPVLAMANGLTRDLTNKAMVHFPIKEPKTMFSQEFQFSAKNGKTKDQRSEFTEWNFFGKDREKRLSVCQSWVYVQYKSYVSFSGLKADFLGVVEQIPASYEDAQVSRLGLRYINEVNIQDEDNYFEWEPYFNSNMLCIFAMPNEQERISRAFHNLEMDYADFRLRYQYGMHNPDYPSAIRSKVFVLDFDAFSEGLQEFHEIGSQLDDYHAAIQRLFEHSITDQLRQKMNE